MSQTIQLVHSWVELHGHLHHTPSKTPVFEIRLVAMRKLSCLAALIQVVDAAILLISDDKRVGTVLLVMAKLGLMEWVMAKQNLRPVTAPTGLHSSHAKR